MNLTPLISIIKEIRKEDGSTKDEWDATPFPKRNSSMSMCSNLFSWADRTLFPFSNNPTETYAVERMTRIRKCAANGDSDSVGSRYFIAVSCVPSLSEIVQHRHPFPRLCLLRVNVSPSSKQQCVFHSLFFNFYFLKLRECHQTL